MRILYRLASSGFASKQLIRLDAEAADQRIIFKQTTNYARSRPVRIRNLVRGARNPESIKKGFEPVVDVSSLNHQTARRAGAQKYNL